MRFLVKFFIHKLDASLQIYCTWSKFSSWKKNLTKKPQKACGQCEHRESFHYEMAPNSVIGYYEG